MDTKDCAAAGCAVADSRVVGFVAGWVWGARVEPAEQAWWRMDSNNSKLLFCSVAVAVVAWTGRVWWFCGNDENPQDGGKDSRLVAGKKR